MMPRDNTAMSDRVLLRSWIGKELGWKASWSMMSIVKRDGVFVVEMCCSIENAISNSTQLAFRKETSADWQEALLHIPNASNILST